MAHSGSTGYFLKEILQGAEDTCDVFEGYLRLLDCADACSASEETPLKVVAVTHCCVGGRDSLAVADSLGFLRYITLHDSAFRLFAVARPGVGMHYVKAMLDDQLAAWAVPEESDRAILVRSSEAAAAAQPPPTAPFNANVAKGTHVSTMSLHAEDHCMFFGLKESTYIYHTGWIAEPDLSDYVMFALGKHSRPVTAVHAGLQYVVSGDGGGTVRVWRQADKALLEELSPLFSLESLHGAAVTAISSLKDERKAVTGSADGTVNVVALDSGVVLKQLMVENGAVTTIERFATGFAGRKHRDSAGQVKACFALGNDRGSMMVFDEDGSLIHVLPTMTGAVAEGVVSIHSASDTVHAEEDEEGTLTSFYALASAHGCVTVYNKRNFLPEHTFSTEVPLAHAFFARVSGHDAEAPPSNKAADIRLTAVGTNGAVWMWPGARLLAAASFDSPSAAAHPTSTASPSPAAHLSAPAEATPAAAPATTAPPSPGGAIVFPDDDEDEEGGAPHPAAAVPVPTPSPLRRTDPPAATGGTSATPRVLRQEERRAAAAAAADAAADTGDDNAAGNDGGATPEILTIYENSVLELREDSAEDGGGGGNGSGAAASPPPRDGGSKKRAAAGRALLEHQLEMRNPAMMRTLAASSTAGTSTSELSQPRGRREERLKGEAQRVAAEAFDADSYRRANPEGYALAQVRNPAVDATTIGASELRYGQGLLPEITSDAGSSSGAGGRGRGRLDKQVDPRYLATLELAPPAALHPSIAAGYLAPTGQGFVYDCPPASLGPAGTPFAFPSTHALAAPFC
eukprot:Rhum_TRINITY_DN14334_c5_g1::Rhum_TRINITY_DN14334_c5_g1_i1::g.81945::m.81945